MAVSHTARVTLNEPSDQIDLEAWLFGLSDSDYRPAPRAIEAQVCSATSRGAA